MTTLLEREVARQQFGEFGLDPSLALYLPLYMLDGSSFMSRDHHGRLATVIGAIWTPQGRTFGGDDYLNLGNVLSFGNGLVDSPFSVIAWVNLATDAVKGIISKYYTTTREWRFITVGARNFRFQVRDDSAVVEPYIQSADNAFALSAWVCFGATYDGRGGATAATGMELYLNGAIIASPTRSNQAAYVAMEATVAACNIGRSQEASLLIGTIGEVLVYSRVLSAQEIQRHYQATKWRYV